MRIPKVNALLICCTMLVASGPASVVQAADVIQIEEYWQLAVGGPDTARSAPQVTMTMSPNGNIEDTFFIATFNHRSFPDFSAGGVGIQRWRGEDCKAATALSHSQSLHHDSETVAWVQRLSLDDGILTFEVVNGSSQSWGTFGGNGDLKLQTETTLSRLNDYRPAISIHESGISYAGNRVSSLLLKKLRWKFTEGDWQELVAPIDIDTDIDP